MKFEFDASEIDNFMGTDADPVDKINPNLYEKPILMSKDDKPPVDAFLQPGKISFKRYVWGPQFFSTTLPEEIVKELQSDVVNNATKQQYIVGRIKNNYVLNRMVTEKYKRVLEPYLNGYVQTLLSSRMEGYDASKPPLKASLQHIVASIQKKKEYLPRQTLVGDISFMIFLDEGKNIKEENPIPTKELPGILTFYDGAPANINDSDPSKQQIKQLLKPVRNMYVQPAAGELYIFPSYLEHGIECFYADTTRTFVSGVVNVEPVG